MQQERDCFSTMRIVLIAILIVLMFSLTSCSSFKKTTEVNLTPFAEQTITMAGSVNYGFMQIRAVYIREYTQQTPEVEELKLMVGQIRKVMRGIVAYSIQVVTLSQASKTGPERAEGLADFIEEILEPVKEQKEVELHYQEKNLDEILENIRKQETLLDALRIAQPLIDEITYVAETFLDKYKEQQQITVDALDQAIDAEFAPVISYARFLRESQAYVLTNLQLLYEYWKGDETALETLRQRETPSLSAINMEDGLDMHELLQAEDIMIDRMSTITTLRSGIKPQLELYQRQKRELQDLNFEMDQTLQRTRAAITIWQRTHQAMAAGIIYPADINLFEISKKIVQVALPF